MSMCKCVNENACNGLAAAMTFSLAAAQLSRTSHAEEAKRPCCASAVQGATTCLYIFCFRTVALEVSGVMT